MLLSAALLIFGVPQAMPAKLSEPAASPAIVETAKADTEKSDSATSSSLPAAPAPKTNEANAAIGESSSVAAEPIQPAEPIKPAISPKFAVRHPAETPRQRIAWMGLSVAGHGAAAFDAYSTRQAISGGYGTEQNPLLRPFAHSGAIYAATQVSPTLMDYVGHKMLTNRRPWVRKIWWVPQAAGAGFSFAAGMHNMSLVK